MAAKKKAPTGVVDTKGMSATPSGIVSAMRIPSSLEAGADISKTHGPAAPNPPRGSKTPSRSAQVPTQERKHKR